MVVCGSVHLPFGPWSFWGVRGGEPMIQTHGQCDIRVSTVLLSLGFSRYPFTD